MIRKIVFAHDLTLPLPTSPDKTIPRNRLHFNNMNIALRRFLHNHGNIATEGSPSPGLYPTLISNGFKGSL